MRAKNKKVLDIIVVGSGIAGLNFIDKYLEKGKKIKLSPILKSAIDKNSIQGEFFEGKWSDVGTPERLKLINLGK